MARNQGDLNVEIGAKLDKVERAISEMQRDFRQASGKMERQSKQTGAQLEKGIGGSLKKIAGLALAAFGTEQIVRFGFEAVQMAGKLEGVERAFNKLNKPELLDELRAATRGTINDLELMQKAVRANNFKIPLEQLGNFFKFATDRAAQTGESVDYLVNSIVDGIGRKSTLVLDNLGISASELQEEVKKVGDFGLAVGNIIERQMGKGGDTMLTTAQKTQALTAQFQNLQTEIGTQLVPAYNDLLKITNKVLEGTSKLLDVTGDRALTFSEKLQLSLSTVPGLGQAVSNALSLVTDKTNLQIQASRDHAETVTEEMQMYRDYLAELEKTEEAKKSDASATRELTEAEKKLFEQRGRQLMLENDLFGSRPIVGPEVEKLDTSLMVEDLAQKELEEANAVASQFLENNKEIGQSLGQNNQLATNLAFGLSQGFAQAVTSGENFGEAMQRTFQQLLQQLMQMIVQMLVFRAIMASLGMPVGAGAGGGNIIGQLLGGGRLQSASTGGITNGPTLAMVGDNPSGREYIIPSEKMGMLSGMSGAQNVTVTGKIKGSDIWLSNERAGIRRTRRR